MDSIWLITGMFVITMCVCGCSGKETGTKAEKGVGTLIAEIMDDNGNPSDARVYARGSDDSLYFAESCIPYYTESFDRMFGLAGRHFCTIGNTFTVHLPAGVATITLERGKEFIPLTKKIKIKPGKTVKKKFTLRRWIDMANKGWYSGDLHVHRQPGDLITLLYADDLNVACVQTNWSHKPDPELPLWLDKADSSGAIVVDNRHIIGVLSHEYELFETSAVLMHHTGKTIIPVVKYLKKQLPHYDLFEMVHKAGGYVEVEKPWWPESHIDATFGKADFVGIINNQYCYEGYVPELIRHRDEFRSDYPEGVKGYVQYCLDLYYVYLNCGAKVMPSAGSASGVLPNPVGFSRIYAKVDGKLTYDSWFEAVKNGHSFVTDGPMLIMTVDKAEMGETVIAQGPSVHVSCTIYSLVPIERLEIVRDGECVKTISPVRLKDNTAVIETDVPVSQTGWIVARCFQEKSDDARLAHTSPVFVEVDGKPFVPKRYAVEYCLKKTREVIEQAKKTRYPSDEAKQANMKVYQQALKYFNNLLQQSH